MGKVVQTCVNPECGKAMGVQSRGLCRDCWRVPEIWEKFRHLYPARKQGEDVTMEDLDRIEAEQRLCLPTWWKDEKPEDEGDDALDEGAVPWVVPYVVLRQSRVDRKGRDR